MCYRCPGTFKCYRCCGTHQLALREEIEMIKNIPGPEDFKDSGIDFFNMAWDYAIKLTFDLHDSEVETWDDDGEVTDEYWDSSQKTLSTALALTQQGIEFLLKGKISSVSPYLLLTGNVREWPHKCDQNDCSFSDFRTIDAQDLIKVHDTVAEIKLSTEFKDHFNKLRRMRNTIMHTVDKRLKLTTKEIFETILQASKSLLGDSKWFSHRNSYLNQSPAYIAFSDDWLYDQLLREAEVIVDILGNSQTELYLGFSKKQRKYICYNCATSCEDYNWNWKFAQLKPNTPKSTSIYCFVCNETHKVKRKKCGVLDCKGNVLDSDDEVCLTCYK